MPPDETSPARRPSRADPMLLWVAAAVLLVARVATGLYEESHPPRLPDLVSWVPAANAPARAQLEGKPILYDFSAEWCGPCQQMQDEVFTDESMAATVSRLAVPVRVVDRRREDGHNPAIVDSLQRVHDVRAFPTLVVVGPDGKAIDRMEGFPGARPLLGWLTRASVKQHLSGKGGASFSFP